MRQVKINGMVLLDADNNNVLCKNKSNACSPHCAAFYIATGKKTYACCKDMPHNDNYIGIVIK